MRAAPDLPDVHEQLEQADLLAAAGLGEAARLLFEAAVIRQGVSPELVAERRRLAAGARPPSARTPARHAPPPRGTIEVALAELRDMGSALGEGSASAPAEVCAPGARPAAIASAPGRGELIRRLLRFLCSPDAMDGRQDPSRLFETLAESRWAPSRLDYVLAANEPPATLARVLADACLADFLDSTWDIIDPDVVSAGFFHRCAGLSSAGLGPYFSNVARIVRHASDVFALARIAAGCGGGDAEFWVAMLSRRLEGGVLMDLIDDLGDLGASRALQTILDRALRPPGRRIDVTLVRRLRDTGLDNGDHVLAMTAQASLARRTPEAIEEQMLLGDIQATAGDGAAARDTFLRCLKAAPAHPEVTERLVALTAGDFARFEARHGLTSPEDRRPARLRRRPDRAA